MDRLRAQRKREIREGRYEPISKVKVSIVKTDIRAEIRHITELAQAEEARIVKVGKLVLFSTRSRDAWLLDPEDSFAAQVCRAGDPKPVKIIDTPRSFGIDWPAKFEIDGAAFIVHERSGRVVSILGYPTVPIAAACGL